MHKTYLFDILIITISFFAIIVLPYFYFYKFKVNKFSNRIIMDRFHSTRKRSILFTSISMFILFGIYYLILSLETTNFFTFREQSSLLRHVLTIVGILILNDAYFYWVHYALHRVSFLKRFHRIHHEDITPTPLSAFNFHPIEAILNFSFYLFLALLVPMTKIDLFIVYIYMLINNSLGHLPLEFCPRWFYKYKISSFLNAATHHIMHHRNGSTNFSLYYLPWDKVMGTISKKYYDRFNEVQDKIEGKV